MSARAPGVAELRTGRARNSAICAILAAADEPYIRLSARGLFGGRVAWRDLDMEQLEQLHATIIRRQRARADAARAASAQAIFSF